MKTDMDNNSNDTAVALEQLKNYIKQQLQTGLDPNEIHTQLQQSGWQDDVIQHAFSLVQAEVVPSFNQAPSAPTSTEGQVQPQEQASQQSMPATVTRGRFKTGWLLFKQSIRVLRHNQGLMRYVIMSFLVSLVLTLIFVVIFVVGRHTLIQGVSTDNSGNSHLSLKPAGYILAFIYYVLAFFIVNLYSAGLVANVLDLFHGRAQHYRSYMKVAWSKGGTLFIFSVIEATVGLILRAIAERSKLLGRIVAWIIGAIWSLARLFVVPVIVTSDDNAFVSIKHSTKLLVSTWGENLIGRVSFGAVALVLFLLVLLPISFILILLGVLLGHVVGAMISIVLVVLLYLAFSILISTASSVLNTALFYYAQYQQIPAAFDPALINSVFIRKKRKWLFGPKITS